MKYIGIIITVIVLIGGIIFGYGQLTTTVKKTEEKVEKHEVEIDKGKEVDIRQSMILERVTDNLDKLEKKL